MTPTYAPDIAEQTQPSQEFGNQEFGTNFRDLPEQLKNAILAACKEAQQEEKFIRRNEVLQDAEHRFYDMGIQHIYQQGDGFQQAQPGGTYIFEGNKESFGTYIDDYNIFTVFALIPRAKLSENEPGIDFQPCNPNEPDDVSAAQAAEGMKYDYDRNNDRKKLSDSMYYNLQMGGRYVCWTRVDEGDKKYGSSRRGTPRRAVKTSVFGCLESKVPILADDVSDFWYTALYQDLNIRNAKQDYPWIAKKITTGTCLQETEYERILRLGILQGSKAARFQLQVGDAIEKLVTMGMFFLRLSAFEENEAAYVDPDGKSEMIDGQPIKVKEKLAQLFPEGLRACVIGQQYAEAFAESMDDHITTGQAYITKGQSPMPVMKPMVVVQDRFNSYMNYLAESMDYGSGSTYIACGEQEFAAITKQTAQPGAMRNLKDLAQGVKISDVVFQEKTLEVPEQIQEYGQFLYSALPQFQLSVPPSIWGQAMADQKTASGYQLASAQAMGILGIFWMKVAQSKADIYYQNALAIMDDAEYPEEISVKIEGKTVSVRKEALTKGDFRAYPDSDSGFPESTGAKRQTLERVAAMLAQTPLAMQIYSSPENIAFMLREEGLPDLVIPEAISGDKQMREIETLLSESPILSEGIASLLAQGADVPTILKAIQAEIAEVSQQAEIQHAAATITAAASGQPTPAPPQPPDPSSVARSSVTPWPSDYHEWEARKCQNWLSSDDRHSEETIGRPLPGGENQDPKPNIPGILNVLLHMMEHQAMIPQQVAPPSGPLPVRGAPGPVTAAPPPAAGAPPAAALPAGM